MASADQSQLPRVLCLTSHNLDAPAYGAVLRARNIFRLLARIGQVRLVLAGPCNPDAARIGSTIGGFELADVIPFKPSARLGFADRCRYEFDGRCLNTEPAQAAARERVRLQKLMAGYDLVWVHGLRIANALGIFRWPHSVLDIDDLPSSFHRTCMAQAEKLSGRFREYRRMRRWQRRERVLPERFEAVCVCSEPDRRAFNGAERVFVLPNGFDAPARTPARRVASPPRIGFIGQLNYFPNRYGIQWFLERVWPQILQARPEAQLRLVGEGSDNDIGRGRPNVDGLGWIADTESEIATWSLAVVPIFHGGGTRLKIAAAFSRKCPVVATTVGAYGYEVFHGRELLIADTPGDFAVNCLELLANPSAAEAMAERAWRKFLQNWTWDSFAGRVARVVDSVLPPARAVGSNFSQTSAV